jgi:hypothetical protein
VRIDRGSLWDSLVFLKAGRPQVFFLPKNWLRCFTELKFPLPTRLADTAGPSH